MAGGNRTSRRPATWSFAGRPGPAPSRGTP